MTCLGQSGLHVLGPAKNFVCFVKYHIENVADEIFAVE